MKTLIQFELKKLFFNPLAQLSLVLLLGLSLLLSFSTYHNKFAYDGISKEGTGRVAVEINKQLAQKYKGTLTDEKVQQILSDFKPKYDLHGLNASYVYQNALQSATFARFSDVDGNWNGKSVADVFGSEDIQIGYIDGWLSTNRYMIQIIMVLFIVLMIIITPIFCNEYQGVNNIILTSKLGRTTCITSKLIASLIATLSITTLLLIGHYLFALIAYGNEGLHCSVLFSSMDFFEKMVPFNITCKTLIYYQIILAFTGAISVTGIAFIFSAICKNQTLALISSLAIFMIPMLLPISETNGLFRYLVLLPLYHAQFISLMSIEQFYNQLLYALWAIPVAIILLGLGCIISRKVFAKHQVIS